MYIDFKKTDLKTVTHTDLRNHAVRGSDYELAHQLSDENIHGVVDAVFDKLVMGHMMILRNIAKILIHTTQDETLRWSDILKRLRRIQITRMLYLSEHCKDITRGWYHKLSEDDQYYLLSNATRLYEIEKTMYNIRDKLTPLYTNGDYYRQLGDHIERVIKYNILETIKLHCDDLNEFVFVTQLYKNKRRELGYES